MISKEKENFLGKCSSVKLPYTKTQERVKIIDSGLFFVCKVHSGIDPNARMLTKLEPNEIFIEFILSRDQIDEIGFFTFKGMNWKITLDPIAPRFPKLQPNESSCRHIIVFKLNNQLDIS